MDCLVSCVTIDSNSSFNLLSILLYVTPLKYVYINIENKIKKPRTTGKLKNKNVLQFKDLHLDINEKRVFINDCEIELQNKQFNLLEYLLLNKGCILLKEQIYDRLWGIDSDSTIEIVEVYVSNLRKKLSKFGYDKYIKTKRKVGYIFDDK